MTDPRTWAGVVRLTLAVLVIVGVIAAAMLTTSRHASAKVVGDPARGKTLFKGFCSSCHTLKAAGATARLGPNLDRLKPTYARVVHQVVTGGTGGAGLPPADLTFGPGIHTFTRADIHDLAAFVSIATHG